MKICVCSIIKDEEKYLEEWINHNINLGIDSIYLYEDYGSKSHYDICKKYDNVFLSSVSTIYIENENNSKQHDVAETFINRYKNEYDWCFFIDIDEYIMFNKHVSIKDILIDYNDYPSLLLFWKMYNANGYIDRQNGSIVETYKEYHPSVKYFNFPYKSCVNLKKCESMINHHEAKGSVNVYKNNFKNEPIYEIMWINHYFTKSWEEWCLRFLERGDIVKKHRKLEDFFIINPKMWEIRGKLMLMYFNYVTKKIKNNSITNIIQS